MLIRTTLIAHRGYRTKAPENTLAAFDLAIEHGYPDIEFDVQLSSDGTPVVIHDFTVDRTTNGHGRVDEHTQNQLRELDAGSWFDEAYAGRRVPLLREVLSRYAGIANIHIELKSAEPELADKVARLLISFGWIEAAQRQSKREALEHPLLVISSFDREQLERSWKLLPKGVVHELLVKRVSTESMDWAAAHGLRSYMPFVGDITPKMVYEAHKRGLQVGGWWHDWDPDVTRHLGLSGVEHAFVDSPLEAAAKLPRRAELIFALMSRLTGHNFGHIRRRLPSRA